MEIYKMYTDGSYSDADPNNTYGGVILLNANDEVIFGQRYVTDKKSFTISRNVGGELVAAMFGMGAATAGISAIQGTDDAMCDLEVYYDYMGVEKFIQGSPKWRAIKECSMLYVGVVDSIKKRYPHVNLKFRKVKAHSGNMYNEMVDRIAAGEVPLECKGKMLQEVRY